MISGQAEAWACFATREGVRPEGNCSDFDTGRKRRPWPSRTFRQSPPTHQVSRHTYASPSWPSRFEKLFQRRKSFQNLQTEHFYISNGFIGRPSLKLSKKYGTSSETVYWGTCFFSMLFLNEIFRWCQEQLADYGEIEVTNFSSTWADGLALCALLHSRLPLNVPFRSLGF